MRYKIGTGVGVIILKENKVLLGKRVSGKFADTWTLPGGKIEYEESFEETAIRETKEETGIEIKNPKVICVSNDAGEYNHFVTIGALAEQFKGEPKVMEPDKLVDWTWFELDDLPDPLFLPSKRILENFRNDKFYTKW